MRLPKQDSPTKARKKSKSLPSLSPGPKHTTVDYAAGQAKAVDYSYLDKFKPPPVQYQTTRWGGWWRSRRMS